MKKVIIITEEQLKNLVTKNVDETKKMKNPCWKGYKMVGTKKLKGKDVPNCVPINKK
jgi:hypothetical protein